MARPRDKIKDKGRIINCFAYKGDQCAVLKDIYCIKNDYQCPFYKTRSEYKKAGNTGFLDFRLDFGDDEE